MEKRTNLVHIINTLNMLWFHKFIVEYQFSWNLLVSWFNKPAFIEVLYSYSLLEKKMAMNVYVLEAFNENRRLLLQNTYDDTLEFIISVVLLNIGSNCTQY